MSSDLKESVVLITSSNPDIRRFGTGFIIHQDEHAAYLLTCMHVVEDVGGLQMVKAGGISATVIASGEKDGLDLAVLGMEGLLDKPTLNLYVFGENGSPLVAAGFQEFAKGFLIRPIRGTLCEEVGLEYRDKADRIKAWELKIDNDYSLRPGYSGAPVIDEVNGYVLGVISHREGEKKGIAISIEAVEKIWPEIPSDLIIKNQKQLIELQHKRISTGLKQQRQQIIEENKCRINQKRRRVVGQRPIDVANYFRNRQREQEEIGRLLAAPSTRLVSVVGRGGMGKTALASKVLSDLERNRWPHTDDEIPVNGIVYLSTRTAGISLERLFIYCARMLGGKQEKALVAVWTNPKIAIGDKVSLLLETLSQGLYVIMMDNIEDLLDDDGQIIDEDLQIFFEKCFVTLHNARLIVTSRIRLAFRHEVMRFDHQVPLIEGLPTEDGIALLRELDPNGIHGLREASDKELIKVVELVHGVPRAIEVFAGILANDPFAKLDEVLQQFYGRDDVVQDLIEEGYKRLDNNACRVMEALSVFGCPAPVLAVDYLLEPFVPALDVPTIARRLIRTHFVSINRGSKTLSLHPIDRDYTYSQLPEEGDYNKKALEHRAAKYYAQLRVPKEAWQTIDDLEPQLAEFEHLVKGGDYVAAALLMNEIDAEYLSLWGYAQRVSNMRKKLLDKITDRELEISNLCNLGGAHVQLGQDREAINYLKQALEIAREIGNKNEEIRSIVQLGHSHKNLGEHEYAIECQQQALALARKIGDQQAEWQALDKLGVIYRNKGLPDKVIQYCQNALVITQQIGNRQGEGSVMENIGIAYRNMKHYDKAHDHLQLALKIAQEGVNRKAEARAFVNLGLTLVYMGKIEDAIDKLQNGISICEEIDYPRFQGFAYESFGLAYLSMQRYKEALENFQKALNIQNDIGNLIGQMQAILGLGDIYWKKGQNEKAIEHIRKALTIAHKLGNQTKEGECLNKLGDIHVKMEQYNQAIDYYQQSRTIFEGISEKKHLVEQVDLKITKVHARQSISGCE